LKIFLDTILETCQHFWTRSWLVTFSRQLYNSFICRWSRKRIHFAIIVCGNENIVELYFDVEQRRNI